jgi:hypothetical protein
MKKIMMVFILACPLAGNVFAADSALPKVGSYGFDWSIEPEKSACVKISKAMLKKFRSCEFDKNGSLGGPRSEMYKCEINAKTDYIVFQSKKICNSQLNTMRATAP